MNQQDSAKTANTKTFTETSSTKTWVLVLTAIASFMVALDAVAVSTALSTIRLDLTPRSRRSNGW